MDREVNFQNMQKSLIEHDYAFVPALGEIFDCVSTFILSKVNHLFTLCKVGGPWMVGLKNEHLFVYLLEKWPCKKHDCNQGHYYASVIKL